MPTNEEVLAHIKQGDSLKDSGSLESAISEYQKAIKVESDNIEALSKLGLVYELKGDKDHEVAFFLLAQNAFEKVLAKEPGNIKIHDAIISLGIKQNRIDDLVKQYKEKLRQFPDNKIFSEALKKLTTISIVSIPPQTGGKSERKGCARIFLDYILPFIGIIPLLLGTMVPKLKVLQNLGIIIVIIYLVYKLSSAKKSRTNKQQW